MVKIYENGAWRDINQCRIYENGSWRDVNYANIYENGAWRKVYPVLPINVIGKTIGDEVIIPHKVYGNIPFIIIGENVDAPDSMTLISKYLIRLGDFSAEFGTPYTYSDLRQWLNSTANAQEWWSPKPYTWHFYSNSKIYSTSELNDTSPENMINTYYNEPGFLGGFSQGAIDQMIPLTFEEAEFRDHTGACSTYKFPPYTDKILMPRGTYYEENSDGTTSGYEYFKDHTNVTGMLGSEYKKYNYFFNYDEIHDDWTYYHFYHCGYYRRGDYADYHYYLYMVDGAERGEDNLDNIFYIKESESHYAGIRVKICVKNKL